MPTYYDSIPENLRKWMLEQPVFFVASAPLVGKHINVSPKGHPSRTFRIITPNRVAYLDHTGSGCETVSHIYENGRVTVMLNSYGASPRIMRLFCTGRVIEKGDAEFDELGKLFESDDDKDGSSSSSDAADDDKKPSDDDDNNNSGDWQKKAIDKSSRSVIVLDVFKVQTSCGYGVPILGTSVPEARAKQLTKCVDSAWLDRDTLPNWGGKMDEEALHGYWIKNNTRSLDGLPGVRAARRLKGEKIGVAEVKSWAWRVSVANGVSVVLGMMLAVLLLFLLGMIDTARIREIGELVSQKTEDVLDILSFKSL